MWSAGLVPCTLVVTLLALSGCRSAGTDGATTAPVGEGQIALNNGSLREAWYAYTRRCGVRVWGEDELGPRVVLHPGQSAAWPETVGCYDLLVLTNPRIEPRAVPPARQGERDVERAVEPARELSDRLHQPELVEGRRSEVADDALEVDDGSVDLVGDASEQGPRRGAWIATRGAVQLAQRGAEPERDPRQGGPEAVVQIAP